MDFTHDSTDVEWVIRWNAYIAYIHYYIYTWLMHALGSFSFRLLFRNAATIKWFDKMLYSAVCIWNHLFVECFSSEVTGKKTKENKTTTTNYCRLLLPNAGAPFGALCIRVVKVWTTMHNTLIAKKESMLRSFRSGQKQTFIKNNTEKS